MPKTLQVFFINSSEFDSLPCILSTKNVWLQGYQLSHFGCKTPKFRLSLIPSHCLNKSHAKYKEAQKLLLDEKQNDGYRLRRQNREHCYSSYFSTNISPETESIKSSSLCGFSWQTHIQSSPKPQKLLPVPHSSTILHLLQNKMPMRTQLLMWWR